MNKTNFHPSSLILHPSFIMPLSAEHYVPQVSKRAETNFRAPFVLWFAATLFMLAWMGAVIGAPVAEEYGHSFISFAIYRVFSNLCHQMPERSFHIFEHQFAVCARCTGIYAGLTLGFLVYPLFRSLRNAESPARIWLLLAPVPTGIDFMLGFLNIWNNTHYSRLLTGAVLGIGCAFFIVPGLVDLAKTDWRSVFKRQPHNVEPEQTETTERNDAPSDYSSPSLRI